MLPNYGGKQGGMGRRDYKGKKETFGDDGYVHYLDCSNGFMS